jgi:hypothetical protein
MMVIGERLYGYCDSVGGEFHVATKFFHVWFVPCFPMSSYIVLEEGNNTWRGVQIGFSIKSIVFAWARAGLALSVLGGLIGGVMTLSGGEIVAGIALLFGALMCGAALFASYRLLSNASPARAQELLAKLNAQVSSGVAPQASPGLLPSPQQAAQQPWPPQQAAQQPWPSPQAASQPWPPQQSAQQPWPPQQAAQQPWPPQQAAQQPWPPRPAPQPQAPSTPPPGDPTRR